MKNNWIKHKFIKNNWIKIIIIVFIGLILIPIILNFFKLK